METSKCDYCKKKTGIMVFNCTCELKNFVENVDYQKDTNVNLILKKLVKKKFLNKIPLLKQIK